VIRVSGYDTILPLPRLERYYMPSVARITTAARKVCKFAEADST
jgi:pyruvate dehydrogenase E1 component beta subunit